jgi:CDP-glucose 4,6-dehydratase
MPEKHRGKFGEMFDGFYKGKRVFLTGHTGFKGGWLSLWLSRLGAQIAGFSLAPAAAPNFYETIRGHVFSAETIADIRNRDALEKAIASFQPDLIFHLAAQPIVRLSYEHPVETFETNLFGTINVLEVVRKLRSPATVIMVTSDKCYENVGWEFGYRENDSLGGFDVYSSSKAACELAVHSWRRSFFSERSQIATVRAGNVIGGGDYAPDRIVPDAIRALTAKLPIMVRNPSATRPWQHVLDCLSGYLWLGTKIANAEPNFPSAFNFGPGVYANVPVSRLVDEILKIWPGRWHQVGISSQPHEAHQLNLAIDRAAIVLSWFPAWSFQQAIEHTIVWYLHRHENGGNMLQYSLDQVSAFEKAAASKEIRWALAKAAI